MYYAVLNMVFITVSDALNAKISAFVAGKASRQNVENCSLINKSRCVRSEVELHESFDIRLHRAEISTNGSPTDMHEFLERMRNENHSIGARVEGAGHENNCFYVIFANLKTKGTMLNINEMNLRRLASVLQELDTNEVRFVGAEAAVRTETDIRWPGVLLSRSWHGKVPGAGHLCITENSKNDVEGTPVLRYSIDNYNIVYVARNLFHLDNLNVHAPDATWNAMVLKCSRLNAENRVRFTL